jgi:hypothetical protein
VQILLEAARAEEVKRQLDAVAEQRRKLIEKVTLTVHPPINLTGGNRAIFDVDVRDPDRIVRSLRVDFRKRAPARASSSNAVAAPVSSGEFYALPVVKQSDGSWRGEIPGTYTRSKTGLVMEWFISANDDAGALVKGVGNRDAPRTLDVAPGSAMALDLKANERLTHETRLALAVLGTPFVSALMVTAGLGAAFFASEIAGPALTIAMFAILPPFGATFGTWVMAGSLLDGADALIPVVVTGTLGLIGGLGVAFAAADLRQVGADDLASKAAEDSGLGVAVIAGLLCITSSAIVPTALVAMDAPVE